ncbi:MAG: metallophosphoesterase [Clostridiales bacterium]|jgi:predicted MPP superfamily phosphohydrolase|nr:metallophosphoesterase [Clostridiales bacterium]
MKLRKILVPALLLVAIISGIAIGSTRWLKIYEHVVYFDNLPEYLQGLRILQISDLHSNHPTRINIDIWPHIAGLDFDLAVITGDIVLDGAWGAAGPVTYLNPHKDGLSALAARVPTFFVEGNHESRTSNLFVPIMRDLGIRFLLNEVHEFEFGGGLLTIVGTKDHSTMVREDSFDEMLALFDEPADFRLVLTHQPQIFDLVNHTGQMLLLAGHTHGGQIRLPFLPTLYAPGQGLMPRYGAGFYHHDDAILYVSRGIGTTYFPIRFWSRPEVAIFELRSR